ncbi:sulfate/molybdate ABC transporter ATP-binding protein [Micropruina sonneratiae]|uniref:sulfate/molybdate ABC transporter ATP-binding protein n=1 Tax=Micropruina sonneratiae TaxID=2986940 RepID=UPI00222652F2|nr:ATP-binding cassette domain-containing protein [Micropruina sp. KQZ13P-5]MCW3158141.1 ATP-binding cassette domain-containing protein [Micropruina sp. KQZ13P-5]
MTGLLIDIDLPGRGVRIELAVPAGQTCALIGPNGAGKSSVLEAVIGVLPPASGRIELAGRALDAPGVRVPVHRRRIGWLAQRPLLFEHMDVAANVAFGSQGHGRGRAAARRRAASELERVGAAELADRLPWQLSGGQAQRVAIARALASDPGALLLDEPLATIDVQGAAEIRQVLAERLQQAGRPALLVTHDLVDLWRLADRVVVLERGRVVADGAVADVLRRPRHQFLASLGGRNLLAGRAVDAEALRAGDLVVQGLAAAPLRVGTATLGLIDPAAIAVHLRHPEGSPRNVWPAVVRVVERRGDGVRLGCLAGGQTLAVDLTLAAVAELGLVPGLEVFLSVKASQVQLYPR